MEYKYSKTDLMIACKNNDKNKILELIDQNHINITAVDENNRTELMYICMLGNPELISNYSKCCDYDNLVLQINIQDNKGKTAFMYVCETGIYEAIYKITEFFPILDPNIQDNEGKTAFMYVCENDKLGYAIQHLLVQSYLNKLNINETFLEKLKIKFSIQDNYGFTALTYFNNFNKGISNYYTIIQKLISKIEEEDCKQTILSQERYNNEIINKFTVLNNDRFGNTGLALVRFAAEINSVDNLINAPNNLKDKVFIVSANISYTSMGYNDTNIVIMLHNAIVAVLEELYVKNDDKEIRYLQINVEDSNMNGHSFSLAITKDAIFVMDSSYGSYLKIYCNILRKAVYNMLHPQIYYISSSIQHDPFSCKIYSPCMIKILDSFLIHNNLSLLDFLNNNENFIETPTEESIKDNYNYINTLNYKEDQLSINFLKEQIVTGVPKCFIHIMQRSIKFLEEQLNNDEERLKYVYYNSKFDTFLNKFINNAITNEKYTVIKKILKNNIRFVDNNHIRNKIRKYNKNYNLLKKNYCRLQKLGNNLYYLSLIDREIIFKRTDNNLKVRYFENNLEKAARYFNTNIIQCLQ